MHGSPRRMNEYLFGSLQLPKFLASIRHERRLCVWRRGRV